MAESRNVPLGSPVSGIVLDDTGRRVLGRGVDSHELHRAAVDPGRMAKTGFEVDGPIGEQGVELGLVRVRIRPEPFGPTTADDPAVRTVALESLAVAKPCLDRLEGLEAQQIAVVFGRDADQNVDVRVMKARQEHAAFEIDDLGSVADPLPDLRVVTDIDDLSVHDRDGFGPAATRIDGVDFAVHEHPIGDGSCRLTKAGRD